MVSPALSSRSLRTRIWKLFLLLLLCLAPAGLWCATQSRVSDTASGRGTSAQPFDLEKERQQIAELSGLWRFHTGDDPDGRLGWASSDFDDSSWALLRPSEPWDQQGYKGYQGFAWYRLRVDLPAKRMALALFIEHISMSYQVFVNGHLIGEFGGLPPEEKIRSQPPQILRLPNSVSDVTPIVIAIRVWFRPVFGAGEGGFSAAPLFGDATLVAARLDYRVKSAFWDAAAYAQQVPFELFGAMAGFVLFFFRRVDREYLWFGCFLLIGAIHDAVVIGGEWFYAWPAWLYPLTAWTVPAVWDFFFVFFLYSFLKLRRDRLFWAMIIAATGLLVPWELVQEIGDPLRMSITPSLFLGLNILVLWVLYRGARSGDRDALLYLFPTGLQAIIGTLALVLPGLLVGRFPGLAPFYQKFLQLGTWPCAFGVPEIAELLFVIGTVAILVTRFGRTRRGEQRMAAELESARAVQVVLIPTEVSQVKGFELAAVYKPATEVGGDFFQVIPVQNHGLLAVIGDVSGKGMPAAMTVSLLVGTVRTLAHYTQNPSEILSAMNQRMLARSNGGFTTCLVLHIDSNGALTVANAGHIPPYVDGEELHIENGLPLGLAANSDYLDTSVQLSLGSRLTLMTDGVAEARNRNGELFGFDRARELSTQSATEIAEGAKAFGQEDDITVVCIERIPVAEKRPVEVLSAAPAPAS